MTQIVEPTKIFKSKSGKMLIDFGQNLAGVLRIKTLKKPAGHQVTFRHAEVLENGELGIRPLRQASCSDTIMISGQELKDGSPKYTFHGFRYVEVEGWTPEDSECPIQTDDIEAFVMHTDMERIGWFSCSNTTVNQLHENAMWSMCGHCLSIPTDCRSETKD